jgi:hypothetical protein
MGPEETMRVSPWAAPLLVAFALAGCGGAEEGVLPQPQQARLSPEQCVGPGASPQADGTCVRTSAAFGVPQAAAAIAPSSVVTPIQLMEWAEKTYPTLFSSTNRVDGYSAPYTYRYYPNTRNYIGVSTGAAAVDVYLYGEISNWSISRVGSLADLTCRVTPDACQVRTLSLSQFGKGTVTGPGTQVFCAAHECSRTYSLNTAVTLTARPAAGWRLRYWAGCDTVAGAACSVTVNDDRTVHPVFEMIAGPVYKSGVVILSPVTMAELSSNQGGVLIFGNSAAQLLAVQPGNVLFSSEGEGLLRRVASIIKLPGGNYIVDTTDATLADVIQDGTIVLAAGAAAAATSTSTSSRSVATQADADTDFDISRDITVLLVDANGDGLSAKASLKANVEFAYHGEAGDPQEIKLVVSPKISLSEVQLRMREKAFDIRVDPVLTASFGAFMPFPGLVLVPTLKVSSKLVGEVKVGVQFGGEFSAQGAFGIHYLKSVGLMPVGSGSIEGGFLLPDGMSTKASGKLTGSLSVAYGLKLYGVAGPAIAGEPFVEAEATDTFSDTQACIRWTFKGGMKVDAEGDMGVLGNMIPKYEATLWEVSREIGGGVLKCEDKEKPTVPTVVVLQPLSPTQMRVSWQPSTDNVGVTGYALSRDGNGIGQFGVTTLVDGHLQPDTQYCYAVAALDKAGNRSDDSAAVCARTPASDTQGPAAPGSLTAVPLSTTSIQLSWSAVPDATGYVVYQNGVAVAQSTAPLTAWRMLKLAPGTQYCYSIAAIDASGNVGAPGAPVCVSTLATAAWSMKIKCANQPTYVVEKDVDLDIGDDRSLSVVGSARDYGGTMMGYQLYGDYIAATSILSGSIRWTFANSSNVRRDEFDAPFTRLDTGDVAMRQVLVTGCDAQIRFVHN